MSGRYVEVSAPLHVGGPEHSGSGDLWDSLPDDTVCSECWSWHPMRSWATPPNICFTARCERSRGIGWTQRSAASVSDSPLRCPAVATDPPQKHCAWMYRWCERRHMENAFGVGTVFLGTRRRSRRVSGWMCETAMEYGTRRWCWTPQVEGFGCGGWAGPATWQRLWCGTTGPVAALCSTPTVTDGVCRSSYTPMPSWCHPVSVEPASARWGRSRTSTAVPIEQRCRWRSSCSRQVGRNGYGSTRTGARSRR